MKCEKHNVEMEWRGSLVAGSMHCNLCAGEKIHMDFAEGNDYTKKASGEIDPKVMEAKKIVDHLARTPIPQRAYGFVDPTHATSIAEAIYRVTAYTCLSDTPKFPAQLARCPYCKYMMESKMHLCCDFMQEGACRAAFNADRNVIDRGHV